MALRIWTTLVTLHTAGLLVGCVTLDETKQDGNQSEAESESAPAQTAIQIKPETAAKIGQRIWQNECGGSVAGLTSWNTNENFASLGIGHFIWYPKNVQGPYQESFPQLVRHLVANKAPVPAWLATATDCPWPDRASFLADRDSARMKELRGLLAGTVSLQGGFMAQRALTGMDKIIAAAPKDERSAIKQHILNLAAVPAGLYALMDYVNFKGEGVNPSERYEGLGWGVLQVLQEMKGTPTGQASAAEFGAAAKRVLGRRIANAPKDESKWKAGWFSRCDSYAKPF